MTVVNIPIDSSTLVATSAVMSVIAFGIYWAFASRRGCYDRSDIQDNFRYRKCTGLITAYDY